ncbi:MAG: DUF1223 domain-containing protein [Burkholderiales bacterium]|nr:DUF1223 domain-containing protein [Burkholderiales bacterium]
MARRLARIAGGALGSIALAGSCAALAPQVQAAAYGQTSPAHRVALVELYTSEGCSSCPPADRWLAREVANPARAGRSVALAFHVGYWDSLGWKDIFAQPAFALRQNQLAALAHAQLVYTPEVFVNGREFRNWNSASAFGAALRSITRQVAQESISLRLDGPSARTLNLDARFAPAPGARPQPELLGYVAVYEDDLTRSIGAGENRGATLHHTRVVRRWLGPIALASGQGRLRTTVQLDRGWNPAHLGVAAFVERRADGEVLQATALPVQLAP